MIFLKKWPRWKMFNSHDFELFLTELKVISICFHDKVYNIRKLFLILHWKNLTSGKRLLAWKILVQEYSIFFKATGPKSSTFLNQQTNQKPQLPRSVFILDGTWKRASSKWKLKSGSISVQTFYLITFRKKNYSRKVIRKIKEWYIEMK